MKLAYFSGCKIPFYMKDYDLSFRSVMQHLDVDLIDLPFNCCGYPARDDDFQVSMLSAIKNLAIAEKHDLSIITPCKCCFGQFKHAMFWYDTRPELREKIDALLSSEGLSWEGKIRVQHLLSFLVGDIGLDVLETKVKKRLSAKKIVVQYGCHALRPFSITGFDNPTAPKIFEQVLKTTGVQVLDWSKSTECCGNPILNLEPQLSLKILKNKFDTAKTAGAQAICTACTHCQMQYEMAKTQNNIKDQDLPVLVMTQILGTAFGIETHRLSQTGKLPVDLFG